MTHLEKHESIPIDTTKPIFLPIKNQLFEVIQEFRWVYIYGEIGEATSHITPESIVRHLGVPDGDGDGAIPEPIDSP